MSPTCRCSCDERGASASVGDVPDTISRTCEHTHLSCLYCESGTTLGEREREREREGGRERGRTGEREGGREREGEREGLDNFSYY